MELTTADKLHFGYTREQWESLVKEGHDFLCERARLGRLTTYTEFCAVVSQRGTGTFIDVGAFGALTALLIEIGGVAMAETNGALITGLITGLNSNIPGDGFFAWAQTLGKFPDASPTSQAKQSFWVGQVGLVFAAFNGTPPGPFWSA